MRKDENGLATLIFSRLDAECTYAAGLTSLRKDSARDSTSRACATLVIWRPFWRKKGETFLASCSLPERRESERDIRRRCWPMSFIYTNHGSECKDTKYPRRGKRNGRNDAIIITVLMYLCNHVHCDENALIKSFASVR